MSVVLFLMKKRVLLFSVAGKGVVGGDLGYFALVLAVVRPTKERVLFIFFGGESAREAVGGRGLVVGAAEDAVVGLGDAE